MATKHQIEAGMRGMSIRLRRVGEEYRNSIARYLVGGAMNVIKPVEVLIVNTSQVDHTVIFPYFCAFVQEKAIAHRLHWRDQPNRVVVTENAINRTSQVRTEALNARQSGFEWPDSTGPEIAGDNAKIVLEGLNAADQRWDKLKVHVHVKVRQLKQGEPVEHWV
jgi:hypothetical protein